MARPAAAPDFGAIDDQDWVFLNGKLIGSTTADTRDCYRVRRDYPLPSELLRWGQTNELMICNENAGVAPNASVEIRSYTHATPGTASLVYATQVGDKIVIMPEFHA